MRVGYASGIILCLKNFCGTSPFNVCSLVFAGASMNAQPSHRPSPSAAPSQQSAVSVRRSSQKHPARKPSHQALVAEVTARLGANVIIGLVAVSALVKLIPYNLDQQTKLQELQAEVKTVEKRVDQLRAEFDRHFDPQQTVSIMQEQSVRVDPNQRQIIWVNPSDSIAQEPAAEGEQHASTEGVKLKD